MNLSIIIPVFNEKNTLLQLIKKVKSVSFPKEIKDYEIILVDDYSTDGTKDIIKNIQDKKIKKYYHKKNYGKGKALRTGFNKATGDIVIIQDADLEYDPNEYIKVLKPILTNKADVVYGSRFLKLKDRRVLRFWHTTINRFLTFVSNAISDIYLTDMETCYKAFKKTVIKKIKLEQNRFGFEPEVTAKIASMARKDNIKIHEVGISYNPRNHAEGKKIHWKDGIQTIWCIIKYNNTMLANFIKYICANLIALLLQIITIFAIIKGLKLHTILGENIANIITIEIGLLSTFILYGKLSSTYHTKNIMLSYVALHRISILSIIIRLILFFLLSILRINYVLNMFLGIIIASVINFKKYNYIFIKRNLYE